MIMMVNKIHVVSKSFILTRTWMFDENTFLNNDMKMQNSDLTRLFDGMTYNIEFLSKGWQLLINVKAQSCVIVARLLYSQRHLLHIWPKNTAQNLNKFTSQFMQIIWWVYLRTCILKYIKVHDENKRIIFQIGFTLI